MSPTRSLLAVVPLTSVTLVALASCSTNRRDATTSNSGAAVTATATADESGFRTEFGERTADLASEGTSPYFVLEVGRVLDFEGVEDGEKHHLTVTVLGETRDLAGVTTRVVEERETEGDELAEVSRNYFAISKRTRAVYYFGEDVDVYKHGKVTSHEGSWHAGENGARFGMLVPADPKVGDRWCQEVAPGIAMDRAAVVELDAHVATPKEKFEHVLVTEETTPLEPKSKERKYYAKGVGLVRDGDLVLVAVHAGAARSR